MIRAEQTDDFAAIKEVNRLAFGQEDEALLVQRIRESPGFITDLSLVAIRDEKVVGHILFSRIHIETPQGDVEVLSLAPMAIRPEFQNSGIGSNLVREGLKRCRDLGHTIVVVIGHPKYYPRFGFVQAKQKNLDAPFPVPDEAFMVCELAPDAMEGIQGKVKYPPEFDKVT
jgi:putative acetyltransferase